MTMVGDWFSWFLCIGLILLNAALVYLAWWALFADRAKGRRRCPKCWYDVAYSPGMTCPECGFVARREEQFRQTRRRFGLAALAIITSAASILYINYRVSQRGVLSMLPNRALIWLLPIAGSNTNAFGELVYRATGGLLSDGEWTALVRRCAAGDWFTAPPSEAWIVKYGNFLEGFRSKFTDREELERVLRNIPPHVETTTRDVWPVNVPVVVAVQVRDWWPLGTACRIRAFPRMSNAKPITFLRTEDNRLRRSPFALSLPPLDPGTAEFTIDFEIQTRWPAREAEGPPQNNSGVPEDSSPWQTVATVSQQIKTRCEGTMNDHMAPIDSPSISQAVSEVFASGVTKWDQGESPVRFTMDLSQTFEEGFDHVAFGVRVELLHEEVVARRLNVWWLGGEHARTTRLRDSGFAVDFEDQELLQALTPEDGRWRLRVTGDAALALRAGKAEKYWNGQVTIAQLRVREVQGPAPPRQWRIEKQD